MMKYNTKEKEILMREYGRHIQKLIEHCVTIADRDERTEFAYSIAEIMTRLFPELNSEGIESRKVWDHINLISGFKLDIDFPCEVLKENEMKPTPSAVPYGLKSESYRVYGRNIIGMIKEISKMEAGIEKDQMIFLIANQMKKLLVGVNADSATDKRVFKDIKDISGGAIDIDPENYRLNEYIGISNHNDNKKKKKKA